ncbi:hypothetical protein E2C01_008626 [Portunus trituberculatus]|uniref:Uncharacterized protein n=1 Tax=Portunus trituberculatus TaxID=210409 RepID=A0A5B7D5J9_PORTR|nr:hypothetical protein [Portunus trituberculatus]
MDEVTRGVSVKRYMEKLKLRMVAFRTRPGNVPTRPWLGSSGTCRQQDVAQVITVPRGLESSSPYVWILTFIFTLGAARPAAAAAAAAAAAICGSREGRVGGYHEGA